MLALRPTIRRSESEALFRSELFSAISESEALFRSEVFSAISELEAMLLSLFRPFAMLLSPFRHASFAMPLSPCFLHPFALSHFRHTSFVLDLPDAVTNSIHLGEQRI